MSNALELKVIFAAVDKFVRPVKAITGAAGEAAKALRSQQEAASKLDGTIAKIDAYEKLARDTAIAQNVIKKTTGEIALLKEEIAKAGAPTEAQAAKMGKLKSKLSETTEKVDRFRRSEIDLRTALKIAEVDTNNLGKSRAQLAAASADATTETLRLEAAMKRQNELQRQMIARQKIAQKWSGHLTNGGVKAMAGGAALNAAAAIPVMAYAKAEDASTQLQIAMMQKGGRVAEEFKDIDALAAKLGNKLPGTTADYQDMMTMLIRQGMPAKNILGGLGEATAYLAVQLKMAPTAAAEFASKLQDATRATDKEMMGLMDTIQRTFYLGVDQNNMLQGFSKLAPALSILRKEGAAAAKDLAPLLVMADQSGMQGEAAGNAYRKIFQMSLDSKKVAKGNAELGGTGIKLDFTDGKGEFAGLEKMYAQLEKLRGVDSQRRLAALKKIFGDDAETLQALTLMIEKGVGGYRDVQAKMEAQAELQERVNKQLGTLTSLWDAAKGTFTNALVALGESIAPELHATAEWVGKIAERTQAWAKENPGLSGGLMTVAKWLGLTLVIVGGLAVGLGSILVPLAMLKFSMITLGFRGVGAFGMVAGAIKAVGLALVANPIGLTLTAIAVAATLIYANWDKLGAWWTGMLDGIIGRINKLRENLHTMMPGVFDAPSASPTRASTTATIANSPILRTAGGNSYAFTFKTEPGAINGGEANNIAQQVRREIERMDAENAARQRSRLRDRE